MSSTFGPEFAKAWPIECLNIYQISAYGQQLLANCRQVVKPDNNKKIDLEKFQEKSSSFPLKVNQFSIELI